MLASLACYCFTPNPRNAAPMAVSSLPLCLFSLSTLFPNHLSLSPSSLKPPIRPGGGGVDGVRGGGCRGRGVDGCESGRRGVTCFIAGDSPFG